jgi:hypothetical protein
MQLENRHCQQAISVHFAGQIGGVGVSMMLTVQPLMKKVNTPHRRDAEAQRKAS